MVKRRRARGASVAVWVAVLIGATAVSAQPARNGASSDRMAGLRVGHWVQLEGTARAGNSVLCTEVRPLTGDFLDDDWSLKGLVRTVDLVRREFTVGKSRILVSATTIYDNPRGTFKGLPDLRPGMIVEVEGALLQNGALMAVEVDDETDEIVRNPRVRDEIEIVGKISHLDPRKRVVTVMGIEFQINERTKLLSAIQ